METVRLDKKNNNKKHYLSGILSGTFFEEALRSMVTYLEEW